MPGHRFRRLGEQARTFSRQVLAASAIAGVVSSFGACATPPPPVAGLPRPPGPSAPSPPAPQAPQAPGRLPAPVTENRTFVTIEGTPLYKLGAGDILEVLVTRGATQEKLTVAVKGNGTIAVLFVEVQVEGLTADQAADRVRRGLSKLYREPRVEILVKEYNSKKATIFGAVANRGAIVPLTGRVTLIESIIKAGGLSPTADLERVVLTRPDGQTYTVNFLELVARGALAEQPILDAGDIVLVQEKPAVEGQRIFVLGEVKNPGAFPYGPGLTSTRALGLAGGTSDVAVSESTRVIRGGLDRPQLIAADFDRVFREGDPQHDVPLLPGDIVYIPRSAIGNWNAFLAKLRPTLDFLLAPASVVTQVETIRILEQSLSR